MSIKENNQAITINQIFRSAPPEMNIKLIAGKNGLNNKITDINPYRPGLAISGYIEHFRYQAVQVLGRTEIEYMNAMSSKRRSKNLKQLFKFDIPCIVVSKSLPVPRILKILCNKHNVPLFLSPMDTPELLHNINIILNNFLAPSTTMHGTLVDIYGVGVLLTGISGIGKSEAALDLVDRGHRLVADDAIKIMKRGEHILMGTGIAPDSSLQYHMEVRGVGIIDVSKLFGIRGVRLHKRVEMEINLIKWNPDLALERVGIKEEFSNILGVEIPLIKVPLVPGKNISVIIEVVALNHILKLSGYDTAKVFNATLIKLMQSRAKQLARLEEDEE